VQNCVYCDLEDPSDHHFRSHRTSECCERPLAAREFYRKDHLRQHLRQVHKVESFTKAMEGWKSKILEIRSRCGFCDASFQLWSERNEHLAEHFRNGASMKDWKGARGFEPAVATLVRHSIPPYLIGTEATAMMPFSAESGNPQQPVSSNPHFPHSTTTPTSFEYLVSELGKFTAAQTAQNLTPTDQTLQEQARLIVYGDNDPWNQTAADNSQWLELFKQGYGIAGPQPPDTRQTEQLPSDSVVAQNSTNFPENLDLPWYWQSPECLAIYRQNKAYFYTHRSTDDPPGVVVDEGPQIVSTQNDLPGLPSGAADLDLNFGGHEKGLSIAHDYAETYTIDPLHQHDCLNGPGDWQFPGTDGGTERQFGADWEAWDTIFPPDADLGVQHLFG
jgi:hypothetical protein